MFKDKIIFKGDKSGNGRAKQQDWCVLGCDGPLQCQIKAQILIYNKDIIIFNDVTDLQFSIQL